MQWKALAKWMQMDKQQALLAGRSARRPFHGGHLLMLSLAIRRETHLEGSEGGRGGGVPLGGIIRVPSQKDG